MFHTLGCIPEDGTDVKLTVDNILIEVMEIRDHMVESAIVRVENKELLV